MSILGDALVRTRRRTPSSSIGEDRSPAARSTPQQSTAATPPPDGRSELASRRDALAEQVTEMHWDLGGLAYEMAIRDHFRLDVLVARAAALQVRDAELAEVERLLALEETASAGNCRACGAPHSRGAVYCWQCGATLMRRSPSLPSRAPADGEDDLAPTAPMDALLAAETRGEDGSPQPLLPADG